MIEISRRDFFKVSALSMCSLVVSTGISGCNNSSNDTKIEFRHGVASGDPLTNSVIIWTRITPKEELDSINFSYEVSKFEDFSVLEHSGSAVTKKEDDYTVKIDLQNLEQDTRYFYRFKSNDIYSIVGKTKTLSSNPKQVKFAVFSCSNYPNGYFNAYSEVAKLKDIDVVLHLGDYIYEYGMFEADGVTPTYATQNATKIGRVLPKGNDKELISLEDYRKRYALYKTDRGSIAVHQNLPFITVWDDHEIANDTYKDGAENHNLPQDGDFQQRKQSALKAYFEWMPIRPFVPNNKEIIYRSFDFGDLVSLHMLDTRVIARDKQLSYNNYFNADGSFNQKKFAIDMSNPKRAMIGSLQLNWLKNKMFLSKAKWQVLGQQVLMGKMFLPAELLMLIAKLSNNLTQEQKLGVLQELNKKLIELISIKNRMLKNDKSLTKEQKARISTVLPYNLDAWDGYAYEREVIYAITQQLNKNLVVLSGDTHNSWANELKNKDGKNVGVEFAVSSVSSPGMEKYAGLTTKDAAILFETSISFLIDDLKYTNLNQRGFMTVKFTKDKVKTKWYYINNINSTSYSLDKTRQKELKSLIGSKKLS